MTDLTQIDRSSKPAISFEIFPPRSVDAERQLTDTLSALLPLDPAFISVTYGAGGSDRDRTIATVARVKRAWGKAPAAHLTCAGQSRDEVRDSLVRFGMQGVRRIVALRGDVANDDADDVAPGTARFETAVDLVKAVKAKSDFHVSVAAYPVPHPLSGGAEPCLDNLIAKFDAGADDAITQFFFDNHDFLRLRDALAARGIDRPLIPGILPVYDIKQVRRFARRCGQALPRWFVDAFDRIAHDPELTRLFALSFAVDQIDDLAAEGVEAAHIYTLNRSGLAANIAQLVGAAEPIDRLDALRETVTRRLRAV